MKKKKIDYSKQIPIKGRAAKDNIFLALAFVGEHEELFKSWIESKGGRIVEEEEN